jgi:hypothetical protein
MRSIINTPPNWDGIKALGYIGKAQAVVEGLNAPASLKGEFQNVANAAELKAKCFPGQLEKGGRTAE